MPSPTASERRMTDLDTRSHLLEREAELEQIGGALRTAAAGSGAIVVGLSGGGRTAIRGSRSISLARAFGAAAASPVLTTRITHAGISSIRASR